MRSLMLAAACLLGGCTSSIVADGESAAAPPRSEPSLPSEAFSQLAVYDRLVRAAAADANVVYSPTSVSQALGLVHLGAGGTTKEQIERFLAIAPGETGDRALAARAASLREGERGVKVEIANALFLSRDWSFQPAFLDATRTIYGASAERVDFMNDPAGAAAVINAWADDKTDGMIRNVVTPDTIQREAAAYLANATFFEGDWSARFKGAETKPFLFGDGTQRPFHMMKNEGEFASVSVGNWRALRMTYGFEQRRFAFDVMMPEARVADVPAPALGQIDAMASALDKATPAPVRVWLPRFEADMRADLIPPLKALGLTLPFDRDRADLTPMAEPGQRPLHIGEAFQVAKLQVYESGTRAAAVTMMVAMPTSAPPPFEGPEFTVDRPFLFAIRDLRTGEVLFFGRIAAPQPFVPKRQDG
ncbi:Serpin (serine protease inhibitor) [Tsuneonella dongtanensis]|uniref:Serpin (Serine protease inhibitor) n=1 Tax=Tsuneonella dongtanensis TaxID=692370 RepID=A0A1B2A8R3_9SPHN|nr:serpin family protein [Tsuneonella dongtanensis]ANY18557.1 Serpin (serine protease inhibitor) [Tsuneonella dongtanensis]